MTVLKRWRLALILFLCLALLGVSAPAAFADTSEQVQEVRQLLEQYHYSKPDATVLSGDNIEQMISALDDPYTEYFDAQRWQLFSSALEQSFVGIGIVMAEEDGVVYVEDVIPGSGAEAAGVLPGDALVSAGKQSLRGKSVAEIQNELRGAEGTAVELGIVRYGKTYKFRIVRKALQVPTVATRMLGDGVGYLALSGFTSDAAAEVKAGLAQLERGGMNTLVFDLRNNGGGYVHTAQEIAGLFVKDGVLAHMKDRDGTDQPLEVKGETKPYPIIILVNGNSASASELLAGALQDYGIAKLAGAQTFGKGVVQSLISLKSGGVLKVTIQEYFTPNWRKVDKTGLKPDIVQSGAAEQLIEAFRAAGGKTVTIVSGKGVVSVNGVRTALVGTAMKNKKGIWHVNLRLAVSALGAKLKYDGKQRTFTVTRGTVSHTIPTNDYHVMIKDGKSFIDVRLLKKWFADVRYSATGSTFKLSAGQSQQ